MDPFSYLCFRWCAFVMISNLFLAVLWSPGGKGLTPWLSCVLCFLVFLSLSHMVFSVGATSLYRFQNFAFMFSSVMSNCDVVTFSLVSWVRCGTRFYRFLIFALFFTFSLLLDSNNTLSIYPVP